MAGRTQGRGETYPYQRSQPPQPQLQPQQQPDPEAVPQRTASNHDQSGVHEDSHSQKPKLRTSCDGCQAAKLGCSQEKPTCRRCLRHGIDCVYSPFRRIGRPRKSTSTRPANVSNATRSRPKRDDVDNVAKNVKTEDLPCLVTDDSRLPMFLDTLPVPPSSPASIGDCNDPWYSWTPDGNPLYNGTYMNLDNHTRVIDSGDPLSDLTDYLDMGASFESHHNMLMDCTMSSKDESMLDFGQSMQPTPPSSTTAETVAFGDSMPEVSDVKGFDILLDPEKQHEPPPQSYSPISTSTRNTPKVSPGTTGSSIGDLNAWPSHLPHFHNLSQLATSMPLNSQALGPNPELTPPLSTDTPTAQNRCNRRCSSLLIQQLAVLEDLLGHRNPSLDISLQVEKDALSLCERIMNCNSCTSNKSCSLLFSIVIEHVMRLLETIPRQETADSCTLSIGKFEVDIDTKATFVKSLLHSRLNSFANVLRNFANTVNDGDGDEYNISTTKEKIRDVYQRLESLKIRIELWE